MKNKSLFSTLDLHTKLKNILAWVAYLLMVTNLFRLIFILLFYKGESNKFIAFLKSSYHGLRLDLSMMGYLVTIPIIIFILSNVIKSFNVFKLAVGFIHLISLLYIVIGFSNLIIYSGWGTLINYRALGYLKQPKEMLASITTFNLLITLVVIICIIVINYKLIAKIFNTSAQNAKEITSKKSILITSLITLAIPILIRGGVQQIPINESAAYFSINEDLNNASVNAQWYLMRNVIKSSKENFEGLNFMPQQHADAILKKLNTREGEENYLFKLNKPNIVIITLESWTAGIISELGGIKDVTPFFSSLTKKGYLFEKIYASGRRTDQMFPSILSGFPAQANQTIIKHPSKTASLPFLTKILNNNGYQSSFLYGGELEFANMKGYLLQAQMNKIDGIETFNSEEITSKWGAHDEYLFNHLIEQQNRLKEPFFSMALTISTHEPFDVPTAKNLSQLTESQKFKQAAHYTDSCLAVYFNKISQEDWYNRTVFILVADHGHILPLEYEYNDPKCYRIPLLIFGTPLNEQYIGKRNNKIGSQHDLPTTILSQLKINSSDFIFSKDLMNHREEFAYFNLDHSFGWVNKNGAVIYNPSTKIFNSNFSNMNLMHDTLELQKAKAYVQTVHHYFQSH